MSQTQDPLCHAVIDSLKKFYETYQQLEQVANSSNEASLAENYGQELSGQDFDENNSDIKMELDSQAGVKNWDHEEVSDNEDDELEGAELEIGWEPPLEGAPQEGSDEPVDIHLNLDTSDLHKEKSDSDHDNLPQLNLYRYIIGDSYRVKLTVRILYTDKYPSSWVKKLCIIRSLEIAVMVCHLLVDSETSPGLYSIQRKTGKL